MYWSEDFFAEPKAVVEDALRFIGVDVGSSSGMDWTGIATAINAESATEKRNEAESHVLSSAVHEKFHNAMKPFNDVLEELLGARAPWPASACD